MSLTFFDLCDLRDMVSAMVSNLVAMTSDLVERASNLITMASM